MLSGSLERKIHSTVSMMIAATIPVEMNTSIIDPMIFPSRLAESMAATEDAIEKKTSGTTSVNIMFTNTTPKGFTIAASGPKTSPAIAPRTTHARMMRGNR